jgi:hypothetical protein
MVPQGNQSPLQQAALRMTALGVVQQHPSW